MVFVDGYIVVEGRACSFGHRGLSRVCTPIVIFNRRRVEDAEGMNANYGGAGAERFLLSGMSVRGSLLEHVP